MVDESMLTGESVPVDKADDDEAFSGTLLVRGTAFVEVSRTGSSSAMGRLAQMLGDIVASRRRSSGEWMPSAARSPGRSWSWPPPSAFSASSRKAWREAPKC